MNTVYLLTGSNLGDRALQLEKCRMALEQEAGALVAVSKLYETEAWGIEGLPAHLNQALELATPLSASALLKVIHIIENRLGRERAERWGVRSIDIDIIYFNGEVIQEPDLVVPHPLMQERRFVLVPLCEIAPDWKHPVLHKTNGALLASCSDQLDVSILE